jgi:predicted porin
LSVGASYDPGPWFALYGWIERKSTTKINAMYVSAGYRVKKFTPYLTYSQDSPASFLPGFPTPTVAAVQSAKNSQNTVSLGVRWDFMKNTDLKLQFDQVKLSDQSNGNLANVPAGTSFYGAKFHVMSAVLDFIF